jgi:hypothetical protein
MSHSRSRDSVVGIATGYGLDDGGFEVRVPVASRIFSSPNRPDRLWGPPSLLSNGYRGLSPVVMRQGREADHSPPANAKVHSPICLHGVVLNSLSTRTPLPFIWVTVMYNLSFFYLSFYNHKDGGPSLTCYPWHLTQHFSSYPLYLDIVSSIPKLRESHKFYIPLGW